MTGLIIKYRWWIIALVIAVVIAFAALLPTLRTDPDIKNYIPDSMVSKINTTLIEDVFGTQEMAAVVITDSNLISGQVLGRVRDIAENLETLESVDEVVSLFSTRRIHGEDGIMFVDPAIPWLPASEEECETLMVQLAENPMVMDILLSDDMMTTALILSPSGATSETVMIHQIDSLLDADGEGLDYLRGGLPYIREAVMKDVKRDGLLLVPLALVVMLLFLWFSFRDARGVVIPFSIVVIGIVVAMGLMPLLGWSASMITLIVPILLIAVANDYGIHMIARYQEIKAAEPGLHLNTIAKRIITDLGAPVILTGLTTIAGILGLLTHSIIPARQVGVLGAAGIIVAVILTLFLLPAWLSLWPERGNPPALKDLTDSRRSVTAWFLHGIANVVTRSPGWSLAAGAIVTVVFATGILLLKVDGNQENLFPARHEVKIASELINKKFGGSQNISLMIEGDIKDPAVLREIRAIGDTIETAVGVAGVFSIADAIEEMSKSIYDPGEIGYGKIPATREGVAQLLELYYMGGDPDDFEKLVDFDYSRAHLLVRISEPETHNIKDIIALINSIAANGDLQITMGGYAYVMSEFSDRIVRGQLASLGFAIVVVIVILALALRSLRGGLLCSLPVAASVIILLGLMGFAGIRLNAATALLSSIMIGIGVDYTIHFIWRYRGELNGISPGEAVRKTLTTTGRGIVFNAFSVIFGFSVLIFSGFTSIRHFGIMILISIAVCLVSALIIIPSVILWFDPHFLNNRKNNTTK